MTVGAHHGADRGVDWSSDPDGIFLCVGREPRLRPDHQTGAIDYVVDYSARFGVGAPLPPGVSLQVGSHHLFINSFPEAYPRDVRVFSSVTDPLSTRGCQAVLGGEET